MNANERAAITYERRETVNRIRRDAEAAWKAKDFQRVAELYSPIAEELTEIEEKRLAYSRKRAKVAGVTDLLAAKVKR